MVTNYGMGDEISLQQLNDIFQSFLDLVENTPKNPITNETMRPFVINLHDQFDKAMQKNLKNEPDKDKETFKRLTKRFRQLKSEFDRIENILDDDVRMFYRNLILQVRQIEQQIN